MAIQPTQGLFIILKSKERSVFIILRVRVAYLPKQLEPIHNGPALIASLLALVVLTPALYLAAYRHNNLRKNNLQTLTNVHREDGNEYPAWFLRFAVTN